MAAYNRIFLNLLLFGSICLQCYSSMRVLEYQSGSQREGTHSIRAREMIHVVEDRPVVYPWIPPSVSASPYRPFVLIITLDWIRKVRSSLIQALFLVNRSGVSMTRTQAFKAQRLARNTPSSRVGHFTRTVIWQRIRSAEVSSRGAPVANRDRHEPFVNPGETKEESSR